MLFIAHTAVVLADNTFIWVCLELLHKLLSPNKTAFSSITLMCKIHSSSANCPPVVFLSKVAPKPDLDTSVFNKKLQIGICIGLNEFQYYLSTMKCPFSHPVKISSLFQHFFWQI